MQRRPSDRRRPQERSSSQVPLLPSLTFRVRVCVFVVGGCACLALLWFAGRSQHSTPPVVVGNENTDVFASTSVRPAERVQITQRLDISSVDVDKDRWPTEVLTDQIHEQLSRLAQQIWHEDELPNELDAVVSKAGNVRLYRNTAVVYDDGVLQVERVAPAAGRLVAEGVPQMRQALRDYVKPRDVFYPLHVKFKVVDITQRDAIALTTILVSLHQNHDDTRWQQNDVWRCEWELREAGPRLAKIESQERAFSRVTYRGGSEMLQDATEEVLAGVDSYSLQLKQDTNAWLARLETAHGIDLNGSHGISVADINGDGRDDVYLCQPGGLPNRLLLAEAGGRIVERARAWGLDICDATQSALFVDLDNDGDQDAVLVVRDQVFVWEHPPLGPFQVRCQFRVSANPNSALAADYDGDGLLDLYVLNHDAPDAEQGVLGMPVPFHDANNGGANRLFKNLGDFQFTDVTTKVGLEENNRRFSLAGCWEDYDDDGDLDLYVANDFGRNNLYRNHEGMFKDVAQAYGVEDLSAGMSVSWGDVNNDGRQDLYVGNMFSSAGNRVAYQRAFHATQDPAVRGDFQRHARGNSLYLQTPQGQFADVSDAWNVTMGRWAWSSKFVDLNNDGLQDLVIANGFITNPDTHDL